MRQSHNFLQKDAPALCLTPTGVNQFIKKVDCTGGLVVEVFNQVGVNYHFSD